MFRLANLRSNQLIDLEMNVMLSINISENGKSTRRFVQLELERKAIQLLTLGWTIVHPITEDSPLYDLNKKDLLDSEAEFVIFLKAFDDAFSQNVHSRTSYQASEIVFDAKFDQIIKTDEDGIFTIDISKVSDYSLIKN